MVEMEPAEQAVSGGKIPDALFNHLHLIRLLQHGQSTGRLTVQFPDTIYNFTWVENKILVADAMNYNRCVKCMNESFEGAWRYSEKH